MIKFDLEKFKGWAKENGFVYPSSEIYGGLANTYDYGPYGTQLKENIRNVWWNKFIKSRDDIFGIDSSIIINPKVWEASGHTESFADVMVEDKVTHKRYRADHLLEEYFEEMFEHPDEISSELIEQMRNIIQDKKNMGKIEKFASDKRESELVALMHSNFENLENQQIFELFMMLHGIRNEKVDGKTAEELQFLIDFFELKSPKPDNNELTPARQFNQLFETEIGIIESGKNKAYLRGEIAQGLFLNFKNIMDSMHPRLPFGIGQAGKAFRNEITMGQFTFRTLEFDLMEFEYFFNPDEQDWNELFEYWQKEVKDFALEMGVDGSKLRWRPHEEFELSHYSSRTEDLEYEFPWGFKEMFAVAYRSDFDLKNHQEKSGKKLEYISPDGQTRLIPHVVEPTFGLSRFITIVLIDAYTEEEVNGETRIVLKLQKNIAPVQIAILPLQRKDELKGAAQKIYESLKEQYATIYDETGSIGKRYRRQDEIGTPFCVTVDFDSLDDNAVTVRDRDTMEQERIAIEELKNFFESNL